MVLNVVRKLKKSTIVLSATFILEVIMMTLSTRLGALVIVINALAYILVDSITYREQNKNIERKLFTLLICSILLWLLLFFTLS